MRKSVTKTLLVMKLTGIILLAGFLHATARTGAQTVTYTAKETPLTQVLAAIEKQTGYNVFYNDADLSQASPVTVQLKAVPLQQALEVVLAGQPLRFDIQGSTIYLIKKPAPVTQAPPPADVHGWVLDSAGSPLEGVNISVKGTKIIVATDAQGNFTLKNIAEGTVLTVSRIGYQTKSVKVSGGTIGVTLYPSTSILDKAQVIAYGAESRRFSVGSVSTVSAEDIERQPVTNVLLALEGQAPGLAINATNGVPGSTVLVQVRGQNSVGTSPYGLKPYDQPLFIVDGVPFAPQNNNVNQLSSLASTIAFTGGILQPGGISPFNNINPNDIESVSILKDADATSIYGTQGSNGVVIITTKKGKPGRTTFNLHANTGFNSDTRPLKLMNSQQYLQFRKDAFSADGVTPDDDPYDYLGYAPDLTIFDQNKYTDWQKVIFGKTSNNTDVHASLSGGTANNTFMVSTGYSRSDFNFPGNFADQRFTLHSALHNNSANRRLTFDLVTDYGYDQNNSSNFGASGDVLLPPNLPDLRDPAGNLVWTYKGVNLQNYQFYSYLKQPSDLQNYNLNFSSHLAYKILDGLTLGIDAGYNRNTSSEHSEDPSSAQSPSYNVRTAYFGNIAYQAINIEPQLNYNKNIGNGIFSALLGSTYKKNTRSTDVTEGTGYSNDDLLGSVNGATASYSSATADIYRYSAAFARLKYIYAQKYIIDLTGRRDGSSNFGPGHQFGDFGSVGAGWIFSEEKAFQKALPFFSYGKLSGSYGTSGSDGITSYQYQPMYKAIPDVSAFQGISPSVPVNLYNPDYSWALKKSLNLALDFGLFNNRLLLTAAFYRDRQGNQLVSYSLPIQTGFPGVLGNLNATIQNQGFEFSANSTNIKTKSFTWSTNFNITFNRNKLISFPNLATSSYNSFYEIGKPTSLVYGYRYKDVNPTTGLFEFYDAAGKATSYPAYGVAAAGGDMVPVADMEVKFMGGIGNNFTYKHFGLYIFCQFSSQNAPNYLSQVYNINLFAFPGLMNNEPAALLNKYWKSPGDNATLQRMSSSFNSVSIASAENFAQSNALYGNDTYLRLKTVSLSYTLPDAWLKNVHLQGGRIYMNAQNVLTITNYKVGDPEQFNFTTFPLQRIVAFGLDLNF